MWNKHTSIKIFIACEKVVTYTEKAFEKAFEKA